MSTAPSWFGIAIALFFAFDLVVVALVFFWVRRKKQYRGFEVITKPEQAAPEARKD